MELKRKQELMNTRDEIVLIVPFMELKLIQWLTFGKSYGSLNRTFYGIETSAPHCPAAPSRLNRTFYGIETSRN